MAIWYLIPWLIMGFWFASQVEDKYTLGAFLGGLGWGAVWPITIPVFLIMWIFDKNKNSKG